MQTLDKILAHLLPLGVHLLLQPGSLLCLHVLALLELLDHLEVLRLTLLQLVLGQRHLAQLLLEAADGVAGLKHLGLKVGHKSGSYLTQMSDIGHYESEAASVQGDQWWFETIFL